MSEKDLQQSFDGLAQRVSAKALELKGCEEELSGVISNLVDAPEKERQAFITRRGELVNLRGVLADELELLRERKDVAYLAIFELREALALTEVQRLDGISRLRRKEMNTAMDTFHRYVNRNGRASLTEEDARERVKLETEKARCMAESQIAADKVRRAQTELEHLRQETEQARRVIGIKQAV